MLNKQATADRLKGLATNTLLVGPRKGGKNTLHNRTIDAIKELERAPWQPTAFADALRITPGIDEDMTAITRPEAISGVVQIYFGLISYVPAPAAASAPTSATMTAKEAADYLGVTLDTLNKYVFKDGWIAPVQQIGRSRLFSRDDLDALRKKLAKNKRSKAAIARHAAEE